MMISDKFINNFKELRKSLEELGYSNNWGVLNAADYGVPQSRKRCFMISKLGGAPPRLPRPIPLDKCLRDYLDPEPVDNNYYLSKEQTKDLIWTTEKKNPPENGLNYFAQVV